MRYYNEDETYLKAECESCKKVLKVYKSGASRTDTGYNLTPNIRCFCGVIHTTITGHEPPAAKPMDNSVRCPKCLSTQLTSNKAGFGLGKAVVGGIALGPLGLLSGFIGSDKVEVTCLKCGYKWEAGKR